MRTLDFLTGFKVTGIKACAVACSIFIFVNVNAQPHPTLSAGLKSIITYFNGNWQGNGHFANGKSISSAISFSTPADSAWLLCVHKDDLPNKYKAISVWGIDQLSGNIRAEIFDNFWGDRIYTLDNKQNGNITLNCVSPVKNGKKYYQRFNYTLLNINRFTIRYETSADSISWRMGDELIFNRVK